VLPVSLEDVEARLGASEFECVLEALNHIHQQGVLHGDIEPRHVVYSSLHTLAPKWIDFSNARQAKSSKELTDEFNQCHGMLRGLRRARSRPNRLQTSAITRGFCPARPRLPCKSFVLSSF
jgi:serine/threonine protein kinase